MTEYTIRKASPGDLELSFAIRKNAMYKYIAGSKGWIEDKEMQGHIADFNPDIMQIIEVDGKPVGVFESVVIDSYIHIHGLYIIKEFQNNKIGSNLMSKTIFDAITNRRSILLQVLKVNKKAKEFYESLGFELLNETEHHFQMIYKFTGT